MERGDQIAVVVKGRMRPKGSSAEVENRTGQLWTLRGGKVVSMRMFPKPEEALGAAGLRDGGKSSPLDARLCRENGTPIWPRTFSRFFNHHVRDAGPAEDPATRSEAHPRDARARGRRPPESRPGAARPATIAITLDTYSHAILAMQEDAADKIAGLLSTP